MVNENMVNKGRTTHYRLFPKIILITSMAVVLFDQLLKHLVRTYFESGESLHVFSGIFYLTRTENSGIAFSMLNGRTWIPILISIIAIAIILYFYDEITDSATAFFTGLIAGGIIGNLIDRIGFGVVLDFIDLRFWPVFNLADAALSIGVVGLVIVSIRKSQVEIDEYDKFKEELVKSVNESLVVRKRKI